MTPTEGIAMATERMVIWQGKSELDGSDIIVLATGVPKASKRVSKARSSANVKTGNMIQIHIVVDGILPLEALKQGLDQAVCGICPHRGKASGGTNACYVNLGKGQNSMMRSHLTRGSAPFRVEAFAGQKVRFGAYGDPAAVPFEVWSQIQAVADSTTGYTHQWRIADPRFAEICMASADSVEDRREARLKGYRTFRVRTKASARLKGEVVCPASKEAGYKTVCATCMACGGTDTGRAQDITIIAHGPTAKRFAPLSLTVI
ncbi:hypothetical protein [Mycobacterium sp. Root265]|uniref:hypothetical protein n=1 Tax=Mycobacterium sp. Root265 TaxID=1736504 RepID=UPI001F197C13|nr:hypothetical protein [Mycobacterium sp. Root265]